MPTIVKNLKIEVILGKHYVKVIKYVSGITDRNFIRQACFCKEFDTSFDCNTKWKSADIHYGILK